MSIEDIVFDFIVNVGDDGFVEVTLNTDTDVKFNAKVFFCDENGDELLTMEMTEQDDIEESLEDVSQLDHITLNATFGDDEAEISCELDYCIGDQTSTTVNVKDYLDA